MVREGAGRADMLSPRGARVLHHLPGRCRLAACAVPLQGVKCPMELSTYFRINASETGQVREHTIGEESGVEEGRCEAAWSASCMCTSVPCLWRGSLFGIAPTDWIPVLVVRVRNGLDPGVRVVGRTDGHH
jgi:hypothetical protein